MTNSLGLSIIIPIFNAQNVIEQTLILLLDQSYNSNEIICVDDHGTDNSITIIQEIMSNHLLGDRISLIKQPHNMGAAMARNVGLAQATGEIGRASCRERVLRLV